MPVCQVRIKYVGVKVERLTTLSIDLIGNKVKQSNEYTTFNVVLVLFPYKY